MEALFDMHCHLDFAENGESVARAAADAGITALCCTVIPSSYVSAQERFAGCGNLTLALGVHPWWVADERVSEVDLARFENLVQDAPFVGEIGLDFAGDRRASKKRQVEVLTRLLSAVNTAGDGRVITFHGVRAASALMDLAGNLGTFAKNTCLFHWFQGSPEEFGRAVSTGACFSVGMRMLATEKGRALAAVIPDAQLLVETDSPAQEGSVWSADVWGQELANTVRSLADLRGMELARLRELLARNSERLLSCSASGL